MEQLLSRWECQQQERAESRGQSGPSSPEKIFGPTMEDVVVISVYWFAGMVFLQGNSLLGEIFWDDWRYLMVSICMQILLCMQIRQERRKPTSGAHYLCVVLAVSYQILSWYLSRHVRNRMALLFLLFSLCF
jgi:hypothetical protein